MTTGQAQIWIPCTERMPDNNSDVMICCMETDDSGGPFVAAGFFDGTSKSWQSQDSFQLDTPLPWPVTHWMPLPDPPVQAPKEIQ